MLLGVAMNQDHFLKMGFHVLMSIFLLCCGHKKCVLCVCVCA